MARIILPEFGVSAIDPLRTVPEARRSFALGRELAQGSAMLNDVSAQAFRVRRYEEREAERKAYQEEVAAEKFRVQGQQAAMGLAEADIVEAESQALIDFAENINKDPRAALATLDAGLKDLGPGDFAQDMLDPESTARVTEFVRKQGAQTRLMATRAVVAEEQQALAKREAEQKALRDMMWRQSLATDEAVARSALDDAWLDLEKQRIEDPENLEAALDQYNERFESVVEGLDPFHREEVTARLGMERNRVARGVEQWLKARELSRAESTYNRTLEKGLEAIRQIPNERTKVEYAGRLEQELESQLDEWLRIGTVTPAEHKNLREQMQIETAKVTLHSLIEADPIHRTAAKAFVATADISEDQRITLIESMKQDVRQMGVEALQNETDRLELRVATGQMTPNEHERWLLTQHNQIEQDLASGAIDIEQKNAMAAVLFRAHIRRSEKDIYTEQFRQVRQGQGAYDPVTMDSVASVELSREIETLVANPPPEDSTFAWMNHLSGTTTFMHSQMEHLPEAVQRTLKDAYISGSPSLKQAIGKFVYDVGKDPSREGWLGKVPSGLVDEMREMGYMATFAAMIPAADALEYVRRSFEKKPEMDAQRKALEAEKPRHMAAAREIAVRLIEDRQLDQPLGIRDNLAELAKLPYLGINLDFGTVAPQLRQDVQPAETVAFYSGEVVNLIQKLAVDRYVHGFTQGKTLEDAVEETIQAVMGPQSPVGITWMDGGLAGLSHYSVEKRLGPVPLFQVEVPKGALGDAYRQKLAGEDITLPEGELPVSDYLRPTGSSTIYGKFLDVFRDRAVVQTQPTEPTAKGAGVAQGRLLPQIGVREEAEATKWFEWLNGVGIGGMPVDPQTAEDLRGRIGFQVEEEFTVHKPVLDSNGKVVEGLDGKPITRAVRGWRVAPFYLGHAAEDIMDRRTVPLPDAAGGYEARTTGGATSMFRHFRLNDRGTRATMDITEEDLGLMGYRDLQSILQMRSEQNKGVGTWMYENLFRPTAPAQSGQVPYL